LVSFSQFEIPFQSDSTYKANKVKARILTYRNSKFKNYEDRFDTNGRCIEKIIYDTIGRMILRRTLEYDNVGRIINQLSYHYLSKDTITNKIHLISNPDSNGITTTTFQYDELNRMIKSVRISNKKAVLSETEITYDPKIITIKDWVGDTAYYQTITYYGKSGYPVKQLRKHILRGKTRTSEYRYKNIINKAGFLEKKYIKLADYDYEFTNPNLDKVFFYQEERFFYSSSGLLVSIISVSPSDNTDYITELSIEYLAR